MSEQPTGWLKRMLAGDASLVQLQGKLTAVAVELDNTTRALKVEQDQSALKDKELAGLRETLESSASRAEQLKQDLARAQRELEQVREELATERSKAEHQRGEFERTLTENKSHMDRVVSEAKANAERARLLAEAEKLKTKSAYSQVQGLEKRAEGLQQQCSAREQELLQARTSLSTTQAQLENVGTLRDDLKRKSDELTKAKSEWSSQRAGLDATILKQRSRQEEHLQRMAVLEGDLAEAMEKQRVAEEASRTEKQAVGHVRAELERLRKAQELLVRDERVRWTLLVNRMWKALERSLGKAALVSLAGALDGDETLGRLSKASTAELAVPGLTQALATLSPGSDVSVTPLDEGFEIRVRRPSAAPDACAPGWLGVYAVECLGNMLGRGMRAASVAQNGAEVLVRARFRDAAESVRAPAGSAGQQVAG
ncbi:MAG: hypothetical protein QM778_34070 [Myxococcales bacterium]